MFKKKQRARNPNFAITDTKDVGYAPHEDRMMKIAIALPCSGRYPIGGFRIIYEHANRLADAGHLVTIFHATNLAFNRDNPKNRLRSILLFVRNKILGMYKPSKWFRLDSRIKTKCSMMIDIPKRQDFDVALATSWQTASPIAGCHAKRKYYFIQHFEDWDGDAAPVVASWRLPLSKIAISKWLVRLIEAKGESCRLVPNAIDTTFFRPSIPIAQREPRSVLLQLHPKQWKGSADALEAVKILRNRGEQIDLTLFGIADAANFSIEGPYRFVRNPSQAALRDLYGMTAIFVAASWTEGWGLTPHEASACGAAVAATDVDGHREFLENEGSALLSPARNPRALAANIQRLLHDQDLRVRIAQTGQASALQFSWARAASLFEETLLNSW